MRSELDKKKVISSYPDIGREVAGGDPGWN